MIRTIVRSSLRFRLLVVGIAAGSWSWASCSCATRRSTCFPEFTPALRGDPDRGARPVGGGGRAADHRSARGGPAERRPGRRRDPLPVAARPVVDRARLRARDRRLPRPAAGPGAADAGARPAERLEAPDDAPAPFVLQPGADDRALLGGALADRAVGDRALDDQAAPDGRARRGQRGRSGACATSSSRCRSTRSACATGTSR